MKDNKYLSLVTSNNRFSFVFILIFFAVTLTAMATGDNSFWSTLAWSMFSLLGLFIFFGGIVSHQQAAESKRWPKVGAKLLSARVYTKVGGSSQEYAPSVEYAFKFHGREYKGNTIDYSDVSGSEARAKKIVKQLESQGAMLMVHVNPDNPEKNVLNPGVRFVHAARYIIGLAMIAIGLLYALEIQIGCLRATATECY